MSSARTLLASLIAWSAMTAVVQAQQFRRDTPARLFGEVHRMLPRNVDAAVELGDVDDDGDLDAVIGSRLHLNDGTGLLLEAPANLVSFAGRASAIALGDVDGDEDPDVFLGNSAQNGLYLNDGAGVFSDASSSLPDHSDPTRAVAMGDLDGDGRRRSSPSPTTSRRRSTSRSGPKRKRSSRSRHAAARPP